MPQSYEAAVAEREKQEAATEKQEARAVYSKEKFSTRYPVALLPYILVMLSAIGVLGGLVATGRPIASNVVSASGLEKLIEPAGSVIAVLVALFSVAGYYLGYRRVASPFDMAATALCAIVVATTVTFVIANVLPAAPAIRAYDFPYLGTLQLTTNTPWAFGGLFGAAYGLLFIAVGEVIVIISQVVDGRAAKYFFGPWPQRWG